MKKKMVKVKGKSVPAYAVDGKGANDLKKKMAKTKKNAKKR